MNTKTCKDCPCADQEFTPEYTKNWEWDLFCRLDPVEIPKKSGEWCYRGREIMEREPFDEWNKRMAQRSKELMGKEG